MTPFSIILAFWTPGGWEIIVILAIVLIIFGVGKLPEVGAGLGKGIREFKKATGQTDEIEAPTVDDDESSNEKEKAESKSEKKKSE